MTEKPDVSVLIVNWNTRDLVLQCLDALPGAVDDGTTIEVIVVDNGSVDGSREALSGREDITLIANPDNRGFAAAVNQAFVASVGEMVLLLNSDVDLTPAAISTLLRFLVEHEGAAGAAPLYLNPDGSPQEFHFRLPTFTTTLLNGSAVLRHVIPGSDEKLRHYRMADEDFSRPRRVPQPSASCLLLRRSSLSDGRVFDESYPIFFNDVQLARYLGKRGFDLWVTPDAVAVHEGHASTRMLGGARRRQYIGSVVRMLQETESPPKVFVYRSVVFAQNMGLRILRRPEALSTRDLFGALAGDPGALPLKPS